MKHTDWDAVLVTSPEEVVDLYRATLLAYEVSARSARAHDGTAWSAVEVRIGFRLLRSEAYPLMALFTNLKPDVFTIVLDGCRHGREWEVAVTERWTERKLVLLGPKPVLLEPKGE